MLESLSISAITAFATTALNGLLLYFWQPWAKAYMEETGRQKARQENLDKIVTEMRAISEATKTIESRIAGDLWSQQKHWEQKRAAYGDLLTSTNEMVSACRWLAAGLLNPAVDLIKTQQVLVEHLGTVNDRQGNVAKAMELYERACAMARIFCSSECSTRLDADVKDLLSEKADVMDAEWATNQMHRNLRLSRDLVAIAKADLGVG